MITKEVTLSTGEVVEVATVPQKIYDVVRLRYPDPPVPFIEDSNTATGEPVRVENKGNPDYVQRKAEAEEKRMTAWAEAQLLFGLPKVTTPKGWQSPADIIRYLNPEWEPRAGDLGRRLDYIEWELLRNPADHQAVVRAINELATVSGEATDAIEATFQGDLEGQAGRELPA